MKTNLSVSSIVNVNKQAFSCKLDQEVVVLGIKDGVYYGLDNLGSFIWELIQEPVEVKKVRDAILEKYEVEKSACESDLMDFLEDLQKKELLEVRNE